MHMFRLGMLHQCSLPYNDRTRGLIVTSWIHLILTKYLSFYHNKHLIILNLSTYVLRVSEQPKTVVLNLGVVWDFLRGHKGFRRIMYFSYTLYTYLK